MNRKDLTPQQIVAELDKYIIGQKEAKKKCSNSFA
jgi:ATP-dependent protease HslVU (ClpYQ) ATPase subunit